MGVPVFISRSGYSFFRTETPPTHRAFLESVALALVAVAEAVRLLREASDRYCASEGEEFEDEYADATAAVFAALDALAEAQTGAA